MARKSKITPSNYANDSGSSRPWRYVLVAVVVIIFTRQGFLGISASMKIRLSDGMLIIESDETNTTIDCDNEMTLPTELHPIRLETSSSSSSPCTGYHFFPIPEHHSGLPYLADVFATRDRQYLFFIGNNRGICSAEFQNQDNWMDGAKRFMCAFPGNTMVISEYVAPTGKTFKNNFMFKCAIPQEFQHLVVPGQQSTNLHVDLHSLHNPEAPKMGMNGHRPFPSQKITDTPKIEKIPVCHAGYADLKDKRYELVAYTRTQSTYQTQIDRQGRTFLRSTIHRIQEWMDWHITQGFDHFIIYDNDPTPHGPIENLTKPYVESGLVTYRWFPMKDCTILDGRKKGNIKRYGQAAGGLSAMHRLTEKGAKFMAHMDVDEFFVIYNEHLTVGQYVKQILGRSYFDCIAFRPHVLDHCRGYEVKSEAESPLESKGCFTTSHASDLKLIMKMDTMSHFQVHYPLMTKSWKTPHQYKVPWNHRGDGVGMLAHYRGEVTPGVKRTKWKERVPYFDKFLAQRKNNETSPSTSGSVVGTAPKGSGLPTLYTTRNNKVAAASKRTKARKRVKTPPLTATGISVASDGSVATKAKQLPPATVNSLVRAGDGKEDVKADVNKESATVDLNKLTNSLAVDPSSFKAKTATLAPTEKGDGGANATEKEEEDKARENEGVVEEVKETKIDTPPPLETEKVGKEGGGDAEEAKMNAPTKAEEEGKENEGDKNESKPSVLQQQRRRRRRKKRRKF